MIRALAYRDLAEQAVAELTPGLSDRGRRNASRFLLHLAWHEGMQLTRRTQLSGGPARGFSQFEAHRARDALDYAAARSLTARIAEIAGTSVAEISQATASLPRYGTSRAPWFPKDNLIESLLRTVDRFNVYLTRIALMKIPAAIPADTAARASYWFRYWKVADPDPDGQQARFRRAADEVEGMLV